MFKQLRFLFFKYIVGSIGNIQFFKYPLFIITGASHYKIKGPHQRAIINKIQAGDIVLRRYDNYVSSFMIPGFWDHAGIYIGENSVIHAVGKGITHEDILSFMRTDNMLVLRLPAELREKSVPIAIKRAKEIEQRGTDYDYDFDFSDTSKFCCTEFVYHCYHDVPEINMTFSDSGITKGRIIGDDFLKFNLEVVYDSTAHNV